MAMLSLNLAKLKVHKPALPPSPYYGSFHSRNVAPRRCFRKLNPVRSDEHMKTLEQLNTQPMLSQRDPRSHSMEMRIMEPRPRKDRTSSMDNSPKLRVNLSVPAQTERDSRIGLDKENCIPRRPDKDNRKPRKPDNENYLPRQPDCPRPQSRNPRQARFRQRYLSPKTITIFPPKPALLPASNIMPTFENDFMKGLAAKEELLEAFYVYKGRMELSGLLDE